MTGCFSAWMAGCFSAVHPFFLVSNMGGLACGPESAYYLPLRDVRRAWSFLGLMTSRCIDGVTHWIFAVKISNSTTSEDHKTRPCSFFPAERSTHESENSLWPTELHILAQTRARPNRAKMLVALIPCVSAFVPFAAPSAVRYAGLQKRALKFRSLSSDSRELVIISTSSY